MTLPTLYHGATAASRPPGCISQASGRVMAVLKGAFDTHSKPLLQNASQNAGHVTQMFTELRDVNLKKNTLHSCNECTMRVTRPQLER